MYTPPQIKTLFLSIVVVMFRYNVYLEKGFESLHQMFVLMVYI